MRLEALPIQGAFAVMLDTQCDARGFFARSFCADIFAAHQLKTEYPQHNISYNAMKGLLRGMHFQKQPYAEEKIVRCVSGAVYDVIADMRPASPSYKKWCALELRDDTHNAVYIPSGCAHGFQTLSDTAAVYYMMGARYEAAAQAGFHYLDSTFAIEWPLGVSMVSEKDAALPLYSEGLL